METKLYRIVEGEKGWEDRFIEGIDEAALIIKSGGLVAFPTETVYGLGANALDSQGVEAIFDAKGRPSDNPLIIHIACLGDMERLCEDIPEKALLLAGAFWPGPLTMVLWKSRGVPYITTGGLSTVAIRMPRHQVALELIRRSGFPIAAPSANISGRPSPTKATHVLEDLRGKIPIVLDGGDCDVGIESTVIDLTQERPVILRPGFVTAEEIQQVLGCDIDMEKGSRCDGIPKSPGIKYKHYSPKAEMVIFDGDRKNIETEIAKRKSEEEASGRKVGVILFGETEFEKAAHDFFAKLREMDEAGVDIILAGALSYNHGKGLAVMDRMLKSAGLKDDSGTGTASHALKKVENRL
ncbi:MAG: L-threonylcarbamoyladenylate synthase [Anaerovoracaceae bacterium]|jgi:L-threonylcarbamoyladenylate synthase